jgi:hypothetical protein
MGWADAQLGIFDPPTYPDPDTQALLYPQDANGNCVVGPPICVPETEGPFGHDTCSDGEDNDCDDLVDDLDPDCQDGSMVCSDYTTRSTCRDAAPACEWIGGKNSGYCTDAGGVTTTTTTLPPGVCSDYTTRKTCRADASCSWNNKNDVCETIGPAAQTAGSSTVLRVAWANIANSIKKATTKFWDFSIAT